MSWRRLIGMIKLNLVDEALPESAIGGPPFDAVRINDALHRFGGVVRGRGIRFDLKRHAAAGADQDPLLKDFGSKRNRGHDDA